MLSRRSLLGVWFAAVGLSLLGPVSVSGQSVAIVTAENPDPAITGATADLRHYLKEAAGLDAAVAQQARAEGLSILVASNAQGVTESDLPPKDAGVEAFRIRKRDGVIVIAGRYPVATANGVYTFIQKYLGVRWFTPGPPGEYIPKRNRTDGFDEVTDEVITPVFSPRIWAIHESRFTPEEWKRWMRRNRIASPRRTPGIVADSMNSWFDRFWRTPGVKERQEFYPVVDGKRRIVKPFGKLPPGMNRRWYWAPCWSSDEAVEIVIKGCRDYFDENPEITTVSLAMDDVDIYCECDACRALDAGVEAGSFKSGDAKVSNRWYWLVDKVARSLQQSHPDRFVRTLIYKNCRQIPTTMDRLPDNVIGVLAAATAPAAEWRRPEIRQKEIAESTAWSKVCRKLGRWEYLGMSELTPRYFPHLLDDATKLDAAHNITVAGPCGTRAILPHVAPMYWAVLQQYWQPDLDVDRLLDEFMTGHFAESARPMKAYFDFMEELWNDSRRGMFSGHSGVRTNAQFLSEPDMQKAEAFLAEAATAAKTREAAEKVGEVARAFEFGALMTRTYLLATKLERLPVTNAEAAKSTLAEAVKASRFCDDRDRRWAEIAAGEDLTGQSLRIQKAVPADIIMKRLGVLDQPIDDVFVRAVTFLAKNAPAELAPALAAAAAGKEKTRLGAAARALADAQQPAEVALDAAFWKKTLGYDVDLDEQVTDRLGIADFRDQQGLTLLFDWENPGRTKITLKDFPAFDTKDDQASLMMAPPAVGVSAYRAILTIPDKTPISWQWPAVTLTDLTITDWRQYAGLAVGFHNPSAESEEVGVCIRDKNKTSWQTAMRLAPRQTRILSVSMDDIAKKVDTSAILAFTIWTRRPKQEQQFHVTPLFLVEASRPRDVDLIDNSSGNGGFEKGDFGGWKPETKGVGRIELIADNVFQGRCAARIHNAGDQGDVAVLSWVILRAELDKKRTYRLSFAAKPVSGRCYVIAAGGPKAPHSHVLKWLDRKPGWTRYSFTIGFVYPDGEGPGKGADMPLNWRHLSIQFSGVKPFELLVDDVKFEAY